MPAADRSYLRPPVLLAAVIAAAAIARFSVLGRESYWFDEIHSILQVRLSFGAMLDDLARKDVHPPLYPALLWIWTRLAGETEATSRLISAVAGTAALLPLYGIGRMLHGPATGLIAALLLALNAYAVFYARETRAYALLMLTAFLATWLLLRWIQRPGDRRRAAAYVAGAVLLAYTHTYGLFLLLAHGVYVLGWLPGLRRRFVAAVGLVFALFAPWLVVLAAQTLRVQEGFWIAPIRPADPLDWASRWAGFSPAFATVLGLLIVVGIFRPPRARRPAEGAPAGGRMAPAAPLLLLWVALPIGIPVVASLVGQPVFHPKYAILTLGGFALLAARGIAGLPGRMPAVTTAALAGILAAQLPFEIHLTPRKEQWRELAALARRESNRGALLVADVSNRAALRYYLPDTPVEWLETPGDLAGAEARARAAGGRLVHLQVHPAQSPHEPWLQQRWRTLEEHQLVGARAVAYSVTEAEAATPGTF